MQTIRFICDVMLGRLAKYLRILGFDAEYVRNGADLEHYAAGAEDRIFLTRRSGPTGFARTLLLRSEVTREQLREMAGLIRSCIRPEQILGRCIRCNMELIVVDKKEVESLVPEFVYHQYVRFKRCPTCGRVYWEGSHRSGMDRLLKEILA